MLTQIIDLLDPFRRLLSVGGGVGIAQDPQQGGCR